MTALEIYQQFRNRGFFFVVSGGRLQCASSERPPSPEELALLRAHKDAVIELVKSKQRQDEIIRLKQKQAAVMWFKTLPHYRALSPDLKRAEKEALAHLEREIKRLEDGTNGVEIGEGSHNNGITTTQYLAR